MERLTFSDAEKAFESLDLFPVRNMYYFYRNEENDAPPKVVLGCCILAMIGSFPSMSYRLTLDYKRGLRWGWDNTFLPGWETVVKSSGTYPDTVEFTQGVMDGREISRRLINGAPA